MPPSLCAEHRPHINEEPAALRTQEDMDNVTNRSKGQRRDAATIPVILPPEHKRQHATTGPR
eukprot:8948733-Pyramimonas_sp.AAC.1